MPNFPKVNQSGSRPQQSSGYPSRALSTSRPDAPIGGGRVDGCSTCEQSDNGRVVQLKLTLTDGRESQVERLRRILSTDRACGAARALSDQLLDSPSLPQGQLVRLPEWQRQGGNEPANGSFPALLYRRRTREQPPLTAQFVLSVRCFTEEERSHED